MVAIASLGLYCAVSVFNLGKKKYKLKKQNKTCWTHSLQIVTVLPSFLLFLKVVYHYNDNFNQIPECLNTYLGWGNNT